ncbi:hypothetical protein [Streptomyces sp. NPDC086023]
MEPARSDSAVRLPELLGGMEPAARRPAIGWLLGRLAGGPLRLLSFSR